MKKTRFVRLSGLVWYEGDEGGVVFFACSNDGYLLLFHWKNNMSRCQGAVGAAYVALIAALLLLMRANNQKRLTPSQVRAQRDRLAAQKGGAGSDYGHYDDDDDDDDLRAAAFDPAATATAFEEDGAKYDDFFASSTHKEGNDDDGAEPWWKAIQK